MSVCDEPLTAAGVSVCPGIVLAAGYSKRMGQCKLSLPWGDGLVVTEVLRSAVTAGLSPVGVVVREDSDPVMLSALAEIGGIEQVTAHEAYLGQSASLKAGIRWVLERVPETSGVMVLLGDQPLVDAGLIREVWRVFATDQSRAVAPEYQGKRGHPVILPSGAFADILNLEGDVGARSILQRYGLRLVPTDDRAAVMDMDTWKAYRELPFRSMRKTQ